MAKHGKRYSDVLKKAPTEPVSLEEAVAFVKANANAKFDETVEVAMRLGVDFKKSDQTVRGTVTLPHGTGKTIRVIVFAAGVHADDAKEAGADEVGYEELIEKYPEVSRHLFKTLVERLHKTDRIVVQLAGAAKARPPQPQVVRQA